MAVAVKNVPEATTRKPVNRLALGSLAGAVYIIAAVGVVFYGVPALWWGLIEWLNLDLNEFVAGALLIPLVLAAGVGAVVLGWRLLGPAPVHGLRAGVFFTLAGVLAIATLTSWIGSWLETRELDETISIVITLAAAAGLLYLGVRLLFSPRFGAWLGRVEDQGWFTAAPYKPNQGLRVRRGTIIALVALAGC